MTTDHSSPPASPEFRPPAGVMTVVIDPGHPPYDTPVLELCGPLDTVWLQAALDRIGAEHPLGPSWRHEVHRHGPDRHTLRLSADRPGALDGFPLGLLADLLTRRPLGPRPARSFPSTPLQRELLADADAHPGTGRHVEQLAWVWSGPFDLERFTRAWQSVFDRESVLRSAFDVWPEPQILLHQRVTPEVERVPLGAEPWRMLVERDRRRGIDPRRPGPLRLTVLGGGPAVAEGTPFARVLLTYHHALLDDWSAHLLLREFFRAYLAGGRLPGGDRRPDMGDYADWLADRDLAPARDLWSRELPDAGPRPGGARPESAGTGRTRLRLTRAQTDRLRAWAASWGSTESGVLQAVWALLLYRAGDGRTDSGRTDGGRADGGLSGGRADGGRSGRRGAAPVRFSATVPGRGIAFAGAELLPGALRSPLPLAVDVDPAVTVRALLVQLRDKALDMTAYEWVSAGQVRAWSGEPEAVADSLLVFESRPRLPDELASECAAQGIRVNRPELQGARTAFPVTLVAHHDGEGGLVLTATYDRGRLADATEMLTHSALLLGALPQLADESTTVGQTLDLLAAVVNVGPDLLAQALPDPDPAPEAELPGGGPLVTLRPAARPGAGTVCLVQTYDMPRSCYDGLARSYPGPEAVVLVCPLPGGASARHPALRLFADGGGPLVLGGFSGGGVAAHELTRMIAAGSGRPPLTVLTGATDGAVLARMLHSIAEQRCRLGG
jgi:Condensation domain